MKLKTIALITALGAASLTPAPAIAQASKLSANEGEVMEVYRESGEIAIRHGPLPELSMDPMSMVFVVADPALLRRVRKGDRVKFKAGLHNGRFAVMSIERIAGRGKK
jgi:Cu(I)/Ag(I) efflux system periplasmic protein CusF